ncbi:MAG: DUF3105 domain-containing protein [Actinomycetota bacterium]
MATRPTKAERRAQARLERRQAAASAQRSARNRTIGLLVVGLVAIAAVVVVVTREPASEPAPTDLTALLASSTQAATDAGCSTVQTVPAYQPEALDRSHTGSEEVADMPPIADYPSIPPTSGPHDPAPLAAGVYDRAPDLGMAIHSLEHGGVIIWYAPDAPAEDIRALTDLYSRYDEAGARVIVAPYDYPGEGPAGALPSGTQMALVSWHRLQTCASIDPAAAFGFSARQAFPAYASEQYLGEAPEPGAQM